MFAYCIDNPIVYLDNAAEAPEYTLDINGDGADDCFVYSYTYTTGILRWEETHIGYVYIYKGVDHGFFENEKNKPVNFNLQSDLMVGDYTEQSNSTLYLYQAQFVSSNSYSKIIDILFEYVSDNNRNWNRTKESVLTEWKEHKRYSFASTRAQNVDLDEAEEGKSFWYFLRKAVNAFLH